MSNKNSQQIGSSGENLAAAHLEQMGYEIVERNYRYSRSEIDIIALKQNELLIFVEVKKRTNLAFGEPETFVSNDQKQRIMAAAESYIFAINWKKDIRFDIISIDQEDQLLHIKDAFY